MRSLLKRALVSLFGISSLAFANDPSFIPNGEAAMVAEIVAGQFDFEKNEMVLDVRYGGGCQEHVLILDYTSCAEDQSSCSANLIQLSGFEDLCRAVVVDELRIPLEPRFAEVGEMIIYGANESKSVIGLQQSDDPNPAAVLSGEYAQKEKEVVLDVRYMGGCAEHKFELNIEECEGGQCVAKLDRVSGFDERCKSVVFDSVRVAIDPVRFEEISSLKIKGGFGSSINVEIYK